jgi:hypothetical protein
MLVDVGALFAEPGREIPDDGVFRARLIWGAHCHSEPPPGGVEGQRFASWEHVICADFVGLAAAADFEQPTQPLVLKGIRAPCKWDTPLLGARTFGEIVCLAGDFYAHLDADAAHDFEWAWPPLGTVAGWLTGDYRETTLTGDKPASVGELLCVIRRDKDKHGNAAGEFVAMAYDVLAHDFPARRYLALSSQNYCHFACPGPGAPDNEALRLYAAYHERALRQAAAAPSAADSDTALRRALVTDAFACHFLSDLFASGHLRVPRRLLGERYGVLRGALHMSLQMHNEDNELGLWCTPRLPRPGQARLVWRAYGDGKLRSPEAGPHRWLVQEAVRRSAAEVFAAFCRVDMAPIDCAVALLPVPLPPGNAPGPEDRVVPEGGPANRRPGPNHWPLYWFSEHGDVTHRRGRPSDGAYESADWF